MVRDALLKEALRLPVRDRADVAAELLASLDDEAPDDLEAAEKAWAIEIERRGRRALAGESAGLPWEEVRQRLEARLASK
jgi:putative addiction module component (TIGR02574 family)